MKILIHFLFVYRNLFNINDFNSFLLSFWLILTVLLKYKKSVEYKTNRTLHQSVTDKIETRQKSYLWRYLFHSKIQKIEFAD